MSPELQREAAILTGFFGGRLEPIPETPAAAPGKKAPPAPVAEPEKPPVPDEVPFAGADDFPDDGIPFPNDEDAPPPEEE